jgi:serine/threonine protein kinase
MRLTPRPQVLGKGSFGTVTKVRRRGTDKMFVWKELNYGTMSESEKKLVVSEVMLGFRASVPLIPHADFIRAGQVNILHDLRNPYIVRYHDRINDRKEAKIYIIMEHCQEGDLASLIKRKRTERYVRRLRTTQTLRL